MYRGVRMNEVKLNLARKYRSKNFKEIVGQSLAVRMLQNSLFLDQYFPVYLFAGQRGCGKTSMARLFAASINCEQLPEFQRKPRDVSLPCQECGSCSAMRSGKHPDFIEIDAASHTGVDHVRQIIDAASLLPVLGSKKIYLIDEAHMLSKAAFNAFLKILEEPPASVIFILATTDMYKIIDTVRSRCFQLFFKPIAADLLTTHLETICREEGITYDREGLGLIAQQTGGSARDAINLLEQVRFATQTVDHKTVLEVLGYLSDEQVLTMLALVLQGNAHELLVLLHGLPLRHYNASLVWQQFVRAVRNVLLVSYRCQPDDLAGYKEQMLALAQQGSIVQLIGILQQIYAYELQFAKTTQQHELFEMMLLALCQKSETVPKVAPSGESKPQSYAAKQEPRALVKASVENQSVSAAPATVTLQKENTTPVVTQPSGEPQTPWGHVMQLIARKDDYLMQSVFSQMKFIAFNADAKKIKVTLPAQYSFFQELLDTHKGDWKPFVLEAFGIDAQLEVTLDEKAVVPPVPVERKQRPDEGEKKNEIRRPPVARPTQPARSGQRFNQQNRRPARMVRESVVDVSDQTKWKTANLLLSVLPGSITEVITEVSHG